MVAAAGTPTMIESFEYASDDDLRAAWTPSGNATISLSDSVAPRATGKKSLRADFNFPSVAWATETIRGPMLPDILSIAPSQYLSLRLRGDPAFAAADFHNLYLYAWDLDGNFGRWGTTVPANSDWQVYNFLASNIEQPWNSTMLPDQSRISQFGFYMYGSEAAIDPYSATIYVDEVTVRDTPLTEFAPPSAPRQLLDDFESYASDNALRQFYSYQNNPAATTITTASLATPAPQGNKALKLAIDFAAGQWPWGSVRSPLVTPFSLPTNAVVSCRFKGDPALAAVADAGTTFWINFYDKAGQPITFSTPAAPVISSDWTNLQVRFQDFRNTTSVDTGNLVQWRILVEGWQGTADSTALSGAFYVDDLRITVPTTPTTGPLLSLTGQAGAFKLSIDQLTPGASYELRQTADFSQWTTATVINATAATATWTIPNDQPRAFFQLVQKASP